VIMLLLAYLSQLSVTARTSLHYIDKLSPVHNSHNHGYRQIRIKWQSNTAVTDKSLRYN